MGSMHDYWLRVCAQAEGRDELQLQRASSVAYGVAVRLKSGSLAAKPSEVLCNPLILALRFRCLYLRLFSAGYALVCSTGCCCGGGVVLRWRGGLHLEESGPVQRLDVRWLLCGCRCMDCTYALHYLRV